MRVALFGSPAFAVPTLHALIAAGHEVVLVVTQPDRRAGRGLQRTAPALAQEARRLGLRLAQPTRLREPDGFREELAALEPDVAVTAAYGRLLPPALLEVPRHGFLNVHGSLLPRYRGAAPVQRAIIDGQTVTGITIMQTEEGLDTGPIRLQREVPILPHETAEQLLERLSHVGAEAITEALALLARDELPCTPQDDALATHAPPLTREDGDIRWGDDAKAIYDRHRGVTPWPGSRFTHRGQHVKVLVLRALSGNGGAPGEILALSPAGMTVAAGLGAILVETVQPAGRPRMQARAWANGRGVKVGDRLA